MKVAFCGHSEINNQKVIKQWLNNTVEQLIEQGADIFLLGGYGAFDRMASSVVWELKKKYPHVQSVLVKPYLDCDLDESQCDWTVSPRLENVPHRYAISHRNRYMVDKSNVVVAYVQHNWGGAFATLEYAQQKEKNIIRFATGE